jgi:membrane associated rhomboid family serine protease
MAAWIGINISDNGIICAICGGIGGAIGGLFFGPLLARTARQYVLEELKSREQMSTTDENK